MTDNKVKSIKINQEQNCFVILTESCLRIIKMEPFEEVKGLNVDISEDIKLFGICVEPNLLYLVFAHKHPSPLDSKIMLYDTDISDCKAKYQCPKSITAVAVNASKMVISTGDKLEVHSLPGLELLKVIDSEENPRGLLEINQTIIDKITAIYLGSAAGSLMIHHILIEGPIQLDVPLMIHHHSRELSCIALNYEGTKAATACKSMFEPIVIWDTIYLNKIAHYTCLPQICSLVFNKTSEYICCTDEVGQVCIYEVSISQQTEGFIGSIMYWWALLPRSPYARFRLKPYTRSVCAFGPSNTVFTVGYDESFNKIEYKVEPDKSFDVVDSFTFSSE